MYALIQEVAMMQEDVIDVRQQVAEGQQKQPAQGGA
jgi:hypothetical protein